MSWMCLSTIKAIHLRPILKLVSLLFLEELQTLKRIRLKVLILLLMDKRLLNLMKTVIISLKILNLVPTLLKQTTNTSSLNPFITSKSQFGLITFQNQSSPIFIFVEKLISTLMTLLKMNKLTFLTQMSEFSYNPKEKSDQQFLTMMELTALELNQVNMIFIVKPKKHR